MAREAIVAIGNHFEGKEVLVTGGLGFLGGHLVDALVRGGAEVTVLDLATVEERVCRLREPSLAARVRLVQGSITDAYLLSGLFRERTFNWVFNFAAASTVIEKAHFEPQATIEANTVGVVNLLEAARQAKTRPCCIFQASTDKVYGDTNAAYDEEDALRAVGIYDAAKLAADVFARTYHQAYEIATVILRLCNIFGPYDENHDFRLVPQAMKALFAHDPPEPPELYCESIEHRRDYLFVDDCIRAALVVASEPSCVGEAFNLPGCAHLSTPDMLIARLQAAEAVERRFDARRADMMLETGVRMRAHSLERVKAIRSQHSSGLKLRKTTAFHPRVSLEEGLLATAQWYRRRFELLRQPQRRPTPTRPVETIP